jgi:hypothetical protein
MRSTLLILVIAAVLMPAQQAPPATEVYLMALPPDPGAHGPATWINISNSPGYDNLPSFLPDSSAVLFSSNRDGKQTDIYRYDIAARSVKQLTSTPDGEYSPTVTPNGKTFSAIRQAASDGTQLLVKYDLSTGAHSGVVFENVKPVGYHAWIDATHVAMFILGSGQGAPATLQIGDTATGTAEIVATGIGRSVMVRPGTRTVSYITTGTNRMVREYDPRQRTSRDLFAPMEGSQDAVWTPDGREFWMAAMSTQILSRAANETAGSWKHKFNLIVTSPGATSPPIKGITRMAISPNGRWLALVAEPGAAASERTGRPRGEAPGSKN